MVDKKTLYEEIMKELGDEVKRLVEIGVGEANDKKLKLADMEVIMRESMRKAGGRILEKIIEFSGKGYEGAKKDCECGGKQKFIGYRSKQVVTLGGEIFF